MNEDIKLKLVHWVKVKLAAEENTKLLLKKCEPEEYKEIVKLCSERMQKLAEAEWALYQLESEGGLPEAYIRWMRARRNQACPTCWLSSLLTKNHADCNVKLEEYFNSEKTLQEFVLNDIV